MTNLDKYNAIFCETFQVENEKLDENFSLSNVDNWDSVLQLSLVTQMEDTFDVMLEPEEIMDFKSYTIGKEILAKYGVQF
ncbi:MAG: acyl carrier protein [Flavobacterium sp.]